MFYKMSAIRGGIDYGVSFLITYSTGPGSSTGPTGNYYLSYYKKDSIIYYEFVLKGNDIATFNISTPKSGAAAGFTFNDDNNKPGGIVYDNTLGYYIYGLTPLPINVTQTTYANWNTPFLSDIAYIFPNGFNLVDSDGNNSIISTNIKFIPVKAYFQCSSSLSAFQRQTINAKQALGNWQGALENKGPTYFNAGWVDSNDCIIGDVYDYCLAGDLCGTNACKGPCKEEADLCTFQNKNQVITYVCAGERKKWYESKWFFVVLGVFILFGIGMGLLIILIYAMKKKPAPKK